MGKGQLAGMRIICVNTGKKYTQWHTDNLKHMIDQYSGLEYDEFVCMDTDLYDGVFNKLIIFDRFRDGKNIFFDLDVVIYNKLPDLVRQDFTLVNCWWRDEFHTPLNSSIMSWTGDCSHIYQKFLAQEDYYLIKYNKGIDEFVYRECEYQTFDRVCYTIQGNEYKVQDDEFAICLLNQRQFLMEPGWQGWWKNYFISDMALTTSSGV